jgi:crossover junction endodeoxyribonuclease RusA
VLFEGWSVLRRDWRYLLPYDARVPSLPWDFSVLGVPASVQASAARRRAWKAAVKIAAQQAWPTGEPPLARKVQIHITFYHDSTPLDVDNMLKPIQDALCGLVYDDDNQVSDTHGHLRDLNGAYRVRGMTPAQSDGFVANSPFVHVRIEEPSDPLELP